MQTHKVLALAVLAFVASAANTNAQKTTGIPMAKIGSTYQVLGRTGEPLGIMVTLHGVVIEGHRFKGDVDKPILQVQKINGRTSQQCIEIPIQPYATDFGKPYFVLDLDAPWPPTPDPERSLPQLEFGKTYEFRGYETGGFVGDPDEASSDGGIGKQSRGFYFTSHFVVVKGKKVQPIVFSPADFLDRKALVHGRAANHDGKAWLTGEGWQVEVLQNGVWPESLVNARVAVTGVLGKEPNAKLPHIKACRVGRDHLKDQINQHVEFRGEARELNSRWFMRHNGREILVEDMDRLAATHKLDLRTPIEVRGILRKERINNRVFGYEDEQPKEQYIVREASCTSVDDLLPIERFGEPCPWSVGVVTPDPIDP